MALPAKKPSPLDDLQARARAFLDADARREKAERELLAGVANARAEQVPFATIARRVLRGWDVRRTTANVQSLGEVVRKRMSHPPNLPRAVAARARRESRWPWKENPMNDRARVIRKTTTTVEYEGCPCGPAANEAPPPKSNLERLQGLVGEHDLDGPDDEASDEDEEDEQD